MTEIRHAMPLFLFSFSFVVSIGSVAILPTVLTRATPTMGAFHALILGFSCVLTGYWARAIEEFALSK